jgi:hypothetical protein
MQKKIISIPTNNDLIYRQILASLNFLLDLTHQERDVLAEIIKLNNKYKSLPIEDRVKFIFCTEMRNQTCNLLSFKKTQLANITTRLRKKSLLGQPLIDESNILNSNLLLEPDSDGFRLEINLVNTNIMQDTNSDIKEQFIQPTEEEISEFVENQFSNENDSDELEENIFSEKDLAKEITLLPPEDE